jgi:XTP/dITP diphosphohydrolase
MKTPARRRLVIATKNKKKLKEIEEILHDFHLKIESLSDYASCPGIIENGRTFQENAIKKAVKTAEFTKQLTLGEDSGLMVDALGGAPGLYSARFAGKDKDDEKNNQKLLKMLGDLPLSKRKASYVCAVALANADGLIGVVQGQCAGLIGFEPKGKFGFGYDPLFIIREHNQTFAELGLGIKHKISHRFRALEKARKIIQKYIERK